MLSARSYRVRERRPALNRFAQPRRKGSDPSIRWTLPQHIHRLDDCHPCPRHRSELQIKLALLLQPARCGDQRHRVPTCTEGNEENEEKTGRVAPDQLYVVPLKVLAVPR